MAWLCLVPYSCLSFPNGSIQPDVSKLTHWLCVPHKTPLQKKSDVCLWKRRLIDSSSAKTATEKQVWQLMGPFPAVLSVIWRHWYLSCASFLRKHGRHEIYISAIKTKDDGYATKIASTRGPFFLLFMVRILAKSLQVQSTVIHCQLNMTDVTLQDKTL